MKLNRSFLFNTALTITLFTSATLSVQGKEVTHYAQNQSSKSQGEVIAASAADTDGLDAISESSDQEFSSKPTLSGELALAILIIAVCQLVEYSCQSQSPEQAEPGGPNQTEPRVLVVGLGLGYFYRSINGNQRSNQEVKRERSGLQKAVVPTKSVEVTKLST